MVAQGYALAHGLHLNRLILANTLHSPEMWQRNHENINREISNQYPEVWDHILELRKLGVRSSDPSMRQQFASVPANASSAVLRNPWKTRPNFSRRW